MRHARCVIWAGFLIIVLCIVDGAFADGGGRVRVGYVIADEEGNLGVNNETYNLYEGPSVSLEDFRYLMDNGLNLSANLKRITLNNRHLTASLYKPGRFGVTVTNHQYRRISSFDGDKFTRRRTTGGQLYFYPIREIKLYGGYSSTDKHGESQYVVQPFAEQLLSSTDYSHTAVNVGGQATYRDGTLNLEYRRFGFTDNTVAGDDREAHHFQANAFAPLPVYDRMVVSAGYQYRQDEHTSSELKLRTNSGWAATRVYLPRDFIAECRFLAARSEHTNRPVEIDNYVSTVSVSRNWPKYGGARIGYENRISDDILNRTVFNGLLLSGWFRYADRLTVRARVALRQKTVKDGATLVGDEDLTRHRIRARYEIADWGDISLSYQGKIKTNDDIDTRADYNTVTTELNLIREAYGKLSLTYSYHRGDFENRSSATPETYEFANHVVTGYLSPIEYRRVQAWCGVTYYRSERDRDVEKIGGQVGARYMFPQEYQLEVRYSVLSYDDFLAVDRYYTGNIVNVYLIKGFVL